MISATDLKNGTTFMLDGKPYQVVKYSHTKIGRGGANVKVSVRNLETGNLSEKTFSSNNKFEIASTSKLPMQYLYSDPDTAYFINNKSYEQIEVPINILGNQIKFAQEGQDVDILFLGDKVIAIEIPPKVTLEVVDTVPGVKGNSAANIYKPAKLSNGLDVKVPLFIKNGDKIKVDTRTSEYVERVNT